mmetsp:Transcript_6370/g.13960  ORF Transcript_6370/g.13960 Transcript_6370/m.13960 type:complete len:173 (-) Transcript_6370:74-592(-)
MALITGGLGGLGIIAARELALAGCGLVVTTSRSGRLADTRQESELIVEQMQQVSLHCKAKCDGSDGAAFTDLIAHIQKPSGYMGQAPVEESFAEIMVGLEAAVSDGYTFSQGDIDELEAVKRDFLRSAERLQARIDDKPTAEDGSTLQEVQDKADQVGKMIRLIQESGNVEA